MGAKNSHLIVGGDSVIGEALSSFWAHCNVDFFATTRRKSRRNVNCPYIDLSIEDWSSLDSSCYRSVVFLAGRSGTAQCGQDPSKSRLINVENTAKLADFLRPRSDHFLFLSTSQVFDGTKPFRAPDELTCPITEYGKQKEEVEKFFLSMGCAGVLRLTKVIYSEMPLLKGWTEKLKRGNEIEAYVNRCFAPLEIDRAIKKINSLVDDKEIGIHHCSGLEELSYFDFAVRLAKSLGLNQNLVKGVHCPNNKLVSRFASLSS
ncbi:sugar nucleotide-binding protein [Arenicellales bacterium IMCC57338]